MASVEVTPRPKRQIKKRDIKLAISGICVLLIGIFAYFYWTDRNPFQVAGNAVGPVTAPAPLFGIYGSGAMGPLRNPMGVVVTGRRVFVTDTGNHRVAVFDYDGNPLYTFGKQGNGSGQFGFPYGITVDNSGLVYVADLYNGNIQVFTQDGKFVKYFLDPKANLVKQPAGLFYDSSSNSIFVTDVALNKVMQFDLNGKKLLEMGARGNGAGQLLSPNDVWVTGNNIIVSDTGNDRVEVFDRSGKYLGLNLGDDQNLGPAKSAFVNTRGVVVDGRGTLFVVSNLTDKVYAFAKDGHKPYPPFGSLGQGNDQFSLPNGAFTDNQGRLYFADTMNQRVMVYQD